MPRASSSAAVERRIVAAALTSFERFGYRRANIADIARDAGIAVGTIYRYFANKEALLLRVVEVTNEEWLSEVRGVLERSAPASDRLANLGLASIEHLERRRILQAVLDGDEEMIHAPLLEALTGRMTREIVDLMAGVIEQGVTAGEFREVDPQLTAFVMFVAGRALFNQRIRPYQDVLPAFIDLVNGGMLAAPQ